MKQTSHPPEDFEAAAAALGKAIEPPDLSMFTRMPAFRNPLTKWEKIRIRFWYFFRNEVRAQRIILDSLIREWNEK